MTNSMRNGLSWHVYEHVWHDDILSNIMKLWKQSNVGNKMTNHECETVIKTEWTNQRKKYKLVINKAFLSFSPFLFTFLFFFSYNHTTWDSNTHTHFIRFITVILFFFPSYHHRYSILRLILTTRSLLTRRTHTFTFELAS